MFSTGPASPSTIAGARKQNAGDADVWARGEPALPALKRLTASVPRPAGERPEDRGDLADVVDGASRDGDHQVVRLVVLRSSSTAEFVAGAEALLSPYVAAKSALDGFLESLRAELRAAGSEITVSVVRPGAVDSPFWRHLTNPAGLTPPQIPPLTSYSPEAVARAAVACATSGRSGITVGGSTLLLEAVNAVAWPLTDTVMAAVARLGRPRATPDLAPDALWEPSGDGTVAGGLSGRPSAYAAMRRRWHVRVGPRRLLAGRAGASRRTSSTGP